jgi:hypothetical protein
MKEAHSADTDWTSVIPGILSILATKPPGDTGITNTQLIFAA